MTGASLSAGYARLLCDYLRGQAAGAALSAGQAAQIEAIAAHAASDAHAPTSRADWLAMITALEEQSADPALPLRIGASFQLRHLGLAGHVLINCTTLGEAGRQVVRYNRLMGDVGTSQLVRRGASVEDIFQWPEAGPPPAALEQLWAAATATLGRWLSGRDDLHWEPHFRFAQPRDITMYEQLFRATPRFGQTVTKLVFPASVLDLPIATGNPELRVIAEAQATSALKALDSEPEIQRRTRQAIEQRLGSEHAGLDDIALLLGLSGRTLHRRLAECSCNFRELADAVRCTRAKSHLRNPAVPLAEIAFLLGYREQSTFQHAFKRWTGKTPGEFRATMKERGEGA